MDEKDLKAYEEEAKKKEEIAKATSEKLKKEESSITEAVKKESEKRVKIAKEESEKRKGLSEDLGKKIEKNESKTLEFYKNMADAIEKKFEDTFNSIVKTIKEKKIQNSIKEVWEYIKGSTPKDLFTDFINSTRDKMNEGFVGILEEMDHCLEIGAEKVKNSVDKIKNYDFKGTLVKEMAEFTDAAIPKIGTAVISAGKMAMNGAMEMESAMSHFGVVTGKSSEELKDYEETMRKIYSNNYGESFEDIGNAMSTAIKNAGDLNDVDLQNIVQGAYTLKDVFGTDIAESTRVAGLLMKEAGMTSEQAMDFMAANAEKFSGSWASVTEDTLDSMLKAEGGIKYVNEAMKELQEAEYGDLQDQMDGMKKSVEAALIPLGMALIPILQSLIDTVLPSLTSFLEKIIAPATELLGSCLEPLSSLFETFKPLLEDVLTVLFSIASLFIELATPVLNFIQNALEPLMRLLDALMEPLKSLAVVMTTVFSEILGGLITDLSSAMGAVINIFNNVIDLIKNGFSKDAEAALLNIGLIFENIFVAVRDTIKPIANVFIDAWNGIASGLNKLTIPSWVPVIGGGNINLPTIPRLKVGLDYVPSDFFPAFLDEGEMVLTRSEANWVRAMGGLEGLEYRLSGGQFNQDQKVVLGKGCIVVQTMLDGRTLAQTSAPYMNEELGNIAELRNRGV